MRAVLAAVALALSCSLGAFAAAAPPAALTAARKQVESADYRMTGRLVRVDADGKRTSDNIRIEAHWFPGMLRVLLEVTSPAQDREHVLLEMRPNGRSTIEIAHPGDKTPRELPFSKWADGPLGKRFSYEDFLEAQYFWPDQRDLGTAAVSGQACDQLLSTPRPIDQTHFESVKSCLNPRTGFPLTVEKKLKGTGTLKEFTYFGVRQTRGVWWAHQIEARIRGRAGSTLLIVERGTPEAHLGLHDFDSERLTRF